MKLFFTILLYPFAVIYNVITTFRNYLYKTGYKKSVRFETVIISVGNLTVGGTGKTPHVEYLIRLLKDRYKIATLSRGYGRKTQGFILADEKASASSIGDEPMQFFSKFHKEIEVAVGEERILAIPSILHETASEVILLDDAYQHLKVERDVNILISDYNNPFYKDHLLPTGRLRESRKGANRADIIVVSKCPDSISSGEMEAIKMNVRKYSGAETPIFFTTIKYGIPRSISGENILKGKVLAVSGIARANLFENYVRSHYNFFRHLKFNDHHNYSLKDINGILSEFDRIKGEEKSILITEKDMVKWGEASIEEKLKNYPVFYLPIEIEFVGEKYAFDQLVVDKIRKKLKQIGK